MCKANTSGDNCCWRCWDSHRFPREMNNCTGAVVPLKRQRKGQIRHFRGLRHRSCAQGYGTHVWVTGAFGHVWETTVEGLQWIGWFTFYRASKALNSNASKLRKYKSLYHAMESAQSHRLEDNSNTTPPGLGKFKWCDVGRKDVMFIQSQFEQPSSLAWLREFGQGYWYLLWAQALERSVGDRWPGP